MSTSDVLSLLGVLLASVTCVVGFYKFLKSVETALLERIDKHEADMKEKFNSVWRRFDEHKTSIEAKMESADEKLELKYLRQDIYKNDYAHIRETLESQYKALHQLIEQKFQVINESIKACPALHKKGE